MSEQTKQFYDFGAFRLDTVQRVLLREGQPVPLTPKAYETLFNLVRNAGLIVGKDELLKSVWPDAFVEEGNLTFNIHLLRKALGEESGRQYIETVPKRGYRFVAPVQRSEDAPRAEIHDHGHTRLAVPEGRRAKTAALAVLAIVVLLSVAYLPARRLLARPDRQTGRQMIAVLPFENLTGDPAQEFVSDGLTEEMITRLAVLNHEQLGVIARTSAMSYKGTGKAVSQIGQELGVGYILEGSVRRWADRARISVQLIDARNQTHIWARNYESDVKDILRMQSDVAQTVAQEISVTLKPSGQVTGTTRVDPEVYELCLRGRHEWNKRTQAGLSKAIWYFEQAVSRDPNYAAAYGGLAETYAVTPYFSGIPGDQAASKARAAAERALQLDETLADAHAVLGFTDTISLDLVGAEREYKRALQLNPNDATLHHWYSFVLWDTDRHQESLAELERGRQLDPFSLVINTDEAAMLCAAHETDRAIGLLREAIDVDPNFADAHRTLAIACIQKGEFSQAISEARRGWELDPNEAEQATLAYVYATAGKPAQARKLLAELAQRPAVSPVFLAFAYVGLGDRDQALACLERAYRERSFMLTNIWTQAMLDPLRSDPRFQNLEQRIVTTMQSANSTSTF